MTATNPGQSWFVRTVGVVVFCLLTWASAPAYADDWPQYRGPNTDGTSTEAMAADWPVGGPTVVWTNRSLSNGFSVLVVSQGRAFSMMLKEDGTGFYGEYCAAVDAATGANLWFREIEQAPWDPTYQYNGGDGISPWNLGDGPRTSPSVKDGQVFVLSGNLKLLCLNATNGSVIWSNNLVANYGASIITYENAASPLLDNDLLYVSLNSSTNNQNLAAFRASDGSMAWSSQLEYVTHATPMIATIEGVRQVIFPTTTGLVSLNRTNGAFLWKFNYPFTPISVSMGASPIVYSNIVFCSAAYFRGSTAARITFTNSAWNVQQLYYKTGLLNYRIIWESPVCYQGYVYYLCGENSTFQSAALNCMDITTGDLKWSTNNFGMGGLVLVQTNLLILTENGQLVLARPDPASYAEVARYQAFHATASFPGKCWNPPTFSNGRIYARSTSEAICLDASLPSTLKLLPPQFLSSTQIRLIVSTANGAPITPDRLGKIEVRATNALGASPAVWPKLNDPLVLDASGVARLTNTINPGQLRQFYRAVELQ